MRNDVILLGNPRQPGHFAALDEARGRWTYTEVREEATEFETEIEAQTRGAACRVAAFMKPVKVCAIPERESAGKEPLEAALC